MNSNYPAPRPPGLLSQHSRPRSRVVIVGGGASGTLMALHLPDQPVRVAVFEVDEPIHGVETGQQFAVPQGQGSDCATPYSVDTRYLFGSTGINGQVWIVEEGMTVDQAMAEWETLPQYFEEGRRYKPGETPWMAFAENAEASLADETASPPASLVVVGEYCQPRVSWRL